jgi:hypothetical protein
MEKSKKATANQNILSFGEKVAKLPRIENVEEKLCDLKNRKNSKRLSCLPLLMRLMI